jgi:ankyrin repeat protein
MTPLIYASVNGDFHMVKMLLKHGASPNIQDELGNTALHANSLETGRPNVTEILIHYGGDPTITNHEGKTPLNIAIEDNNSKLIDLIRSFNVNLKEPVQD